MVAFVSIFVFYLLTLITDTDSFTFSLCLLPFILVERSFYKTFTSTRFTVKQKSSLIITGIVGLYVCCVLMIMFNRYDIDIKTIYNILFILLMTALVVYSKKDIPYNYSKYGDIYVRLHMIDCVVIFCLMILSVVASLTREDDFIPYIFVLSLCSTFMYYYICLKKEYMLYWNNYKTFVKNVIKMKSYEELYTKQYEGITTNYFLEICVYVLNDGFIRRLSFHKILKYLRKSLTASGMSETEVNELIVKTKTFIQENLMKRKYDFYWIPNIIVTKLNELEKKSEEKRIKFINYISRYYFR